MTRCAPGSALSATHMRGIHAARPSRHFSPSLLARTASHVTPRYLRVTPASHVRRHVYNATPRDSNLLLNRNHWRCAPFSSSSPATAPPPTLATMSSSEENFDMDVSASESDDYAPAPKKTAAKAAPKPKAAASKPAAKAAAKPKAAPKKKVLKDDNESERDSDSDGGAGPASPLAAPAKKKSASETYQKVRNCCLRVCKHVVEN